MNNLHLGSNLLTPVYFWQSERCFKNLHLGANLLLLSRWRVQICTWEQIVHINAKCLLSIRFYILQTFSVYDFV